MKKVFLTLLTLIVVVGALAGAGYTGYRIGFNQGVISSGKAAPSGNSLQRPNQNPHAMPFNNFGRDFRGFEPGFPGQRFPMARHGFFGFGLFSPLHFLWNLAILALIIWFIYWLISKSGWQITRRSEKVVEVASSETKAESTESTEPTDSTNS